MTIRQLPSLIAFLAIIITIQLAGGWMTAQSVTSWYVTLHKPPFTPPAWVFAPVWTLLYLMIAIAGWRLWHQLAKPAWRHPAMHNYGLGLMLNLAWSGMFFALQMPLAGLMTIVLLVASVGLTIIQSRVLSPITAWFYAPYLAWILFATYLNAGIWYLN